MKKTLIIYKPEYTDLAIKLRDNYRSHDHEVADTVSVEEHDDIEWEIDDPERFVTEGGTGRIRVYGVPDYAYADVTLDQKANIDIVLLNLAPLTGRETGKPGRQPLNPQVWFETQGKETLERMVMELNSRGHNTLYVKEDGAICCQKDNGDETPEGMFPNFPNKVYWPSLVEVLRQNGLAASALDHCIQVAW